MAANRRQNSDRTSHAAFKQLSVAVNLSLSSIDVYLGPVDVRLSRYDVLPDRIIVYLWAKAGGSRINFSFKPRYGINAQTPASTVYDYYNEEAKAVVEPLKFEVK